MVASYCQKRTFLLPSYILATPRELTKYNRTATWLVMIPGRFERPVNRELCGSFPFSLCRRLAESDLDGFSLLLPSLCCHQETCTVVIPEQQGLWLLICALQTARTRMDYGRPQVRHDLVSLTHRCRKFGMRYSPDSRVENDEEDC